jgi:hypothetical protein
MVFAKLLAKMPYTLDELMLGSIVVVSIIEYLIITINGPAIH